jgi:hypothetical protein
MDYDHIVEVYDELLNPYPEVIRKGKTMPYTSVNGNMFSFVSKVGEIGMRLSPEDIEWSTNEYQTEPMIQHGREMKEYVRIPFDMLSDMEALKEIFGRSLMYVQTLKPKPTKKKK